MHTRRAVRGIFVYRDDTCKMMIPADSCCRSNPGDVLDDDDEDPNMFHNHKPGELLCFLPCFSLRNRWFSSIYPPKNSTWMAGRL